MSDNKFSASSFRFILLGFVALFCLIAGIGAWATFSQISGAIVAPGRIEVAQNRQVIQHLSGGIVARILIEEGDKVAAGDPLIQLDDTLLLSEIAILEGQLYELMARRGRLVSERDEKASITFDESVLELAAIHNDVRTVLAGQTRLFDIRKLALEQDTLQLRKRIDQITNQLKGMDAQRGALTMQVKLVEEELSGQQKLLTKGLAQSARVLTLQREIARLNGQLGELEAATSKSEGQITELEIERQKLRSFRRLEAITILRDLKIREFEIAEKLKMQNELKRQHTIRASVSGVVYGLKVFAERSVIKPAEPLLYLIPQDRPLVVATRIEPIHVDQVYLGQLVTIRVSSLDQNTAPELTGTVHQISADIFFDQTSQDGYYRVEILADSKGKGNQLNIQKLLPGMPVESFLKTGDRSPLSYLVKPFSDYFIRALREG